MNVAEDNYCRLCAELKNISKLFDLQLDEGKRAEIVEKLNHVNSATDFSEEMLPKTVCFDCLNTLDRAFEFVLGVEKAQGILRSIFFVKKIKEESLENCSFFDDNKHRVDLLGHVKVKEDELSESIDPLNFVKVENTNFNQESDQKDVSLPRDEDNKTNVRRKSKTNLKHNVQSKCEKKNKRTPYNLPLSLLKLTWSVYNWTCSLCGTQFSTVEELNSHSIQYHSRCNAYRCTDCNMRKLKLDSFLIHVKKHRKYLRLSCYKCHKKFDSAIAVNLHAKKHKHTDYTCAGCNASFTTAEELNNHTQSFLQAWKAKPLPHEMVLDDLTCAICKKSFDNRSNLSKHLPIHTERKRDHICDICGKSFFTKRLLAGHIILHDDIRPFQCKICTATFKTRPMLRNHVAIHDDKKPFSCEACGHSFRRFSQLKAHSIIHTNVLPHVCSHCGKGFRFKSMLTQHIRQHTGDKPYVCQICPRDFANWANYNKHMKRRHSMDMSKKKHTPDGVYPVDQMTGKVIVPRKTAKIMEWKKEIMSKRKPPGRPKFTVECMNILEPSINVIESLSKQQ